jgi:hypothetical protein
MEVLSLEQLLEEEKDYIRTFEVVAPYINFFPPVCHVL